MFLSNDYLLYRLLEEHGRDLIREAEKERLIRSALSNRPQHPSSFGRGLCWLGNRLINFGQNLLRRSEAVPDDLSAVTLNLAK